MRRFCPQLKQGIMKAGAVDYRRSRSPPRRVTFQTQEPEVPKEESTKDGNQNTEPKVCCACLILTDVVNFLQATTNEREMVKTIVGSPMNKFCKFSFRNEHSPRLCRRKTGGSITRYRMFGSDRE